MHVAAYQPPVVAATAQPVAYPEPVAVAAQPVAVAAQPVVVQQPGERSPSEKGS